MNWHLAINLFVSHSQKQGTKLMLLSIKRLHHFLKIQQRRSSKVIYLNSLDFPQVISSTQVLKKFNFFTFFLPSCSSYYLPFIIIILLLLIFLSLHCTLYHRHENKNMKKKHIIKLCVGPARELARASEIYERTLVNIRRHVNAGKNLTANATDIFSYDDLLSSEYLDLLAQLSDCTAHRVTPNCTDICYHNKYRTIDGTCNNFENSLWGTSLSAFRRLLPSRYENGLNAPVGSTNMPYNGFKLPSARLVSTTLISTDVVEQDMEITHMVMQWGQFLDHDLDHALPSVSLESWDGVDCKKTCDFAPPCFPMEVPPNDPRVTNRRCIDFIRSSAACGSGMTSVFFGKLQPREQINQLTAYIDASQVYGYSQQFSRDLRNITLEGEDNGYLREGVHFPNQKSMLPFASPTDGIDCRRSLEESSVNCFTAGDVRVNEQVGLLSMHTIWMREHNRIVKYFNEINPHWSGEQTYQEARKIVGGMMQHITYSHWIKNVIGSDGMELLGEYKGYDSSANPSISNEFATAAFRFGHSLINPILHRLDYKFEPIEQGHLQLRDAFFAPWRVVYEGGVDPLLRGLFTMPAKIKRPEQSLNSELTEKLFTVAHAVSLDLAAMNVQRGRDHALQSYMEYRKLCNLTTSSTFEGLSDITDEHVRNKLKELYGHPDSIDLWVGGILEDVVPGARVGPLFRCIIIDQFRRLRDGDRFYYENPAVFKPEQLVQIKQASLGRVLCDNGDNITRITRDVFKLPSLQGGYIECKDLPMISLRVWTDCSDCSHRTAYNLDITSLPRRNRFRRDLKMVNKNNNHDGNSIEDNNSNHRLDKDDEDVHFISMDNDYFDMNEERIEGLENLVDSFQKTLKKMRREFRKMKQTNNELLQSLNMTQSQLEHPRKKKNHYDSISNNKNNNADDDDNSNLKSSKIHFQCVDKKGINRFNDEIWMEDDCTSCLCQHHQITCTIQKCPDITLKCENGLVFGKKIGVCCPTCIEPKNEQITIDETKIMSYVTNSR